MIATITLNPAVDATWFLDSFDPEQINRLTGKKLDPGGKGINISRFLTMMGAPSPAMGFCGGNNGQQLIGLLDQAQVPHHFTHIQGETRQNITLFVKNTKQTIKINDAGPPVTQEQIAAFQAAIRLYAAPGHFLIFAGKNPPGIDGQATYALLQSAKELGCELMIDSESLSLEEILSLAPLCIKPNEQEFAKLLGKPMDSLSDMVREAAQLVDQGLRYVIISRGAKGLVGVSQQAAYEIHVPSIVPKSSVGAGDSVVAGVVWALSRQKPFAEALLWGAAFGTAMATTDGTEIPPKELVMELIQKVSYTAL